MQHDQYQNLQREVEIHYRMHHKHIAQLMGYFHDEFYVYIVLEYYLNHALFGHVSHQKLKEVDAARYESKNINVRFFL